MLQVIEQLAHKTGIPIEDTDFFFTAISSELVSKIPALQQVIQDIFENAESEKLKEHINEMIILLLEQQFMEKFGEWKIPHQTEIIHFRGNAPIF
jgi:uncharacterized protein YbcC (UPF0753/DUF2309 family)